VKISLSPLSSLKGQIRVPPDKSLTHRAVFLSALADGISVIKNPLTGEDCLSTLRCMEALGTSVEKKEGEWIVKGRGLHGIRNPGASLDCGNSGTTMRLISGILAAQDFDTELRGDESLSRRPMERVALPLRSMGATFRLHEGKYPPIHIRGTTSLKPIHWKNPVASAQVKSAVLLAALHVEGETTYEEPSLSRDHTERMLASSGVSILQEGTLTRIKGPSSLKSQTWEIPGDFSSAAFFLVAGLLAQKADVLLQDVNLNPTRTGLLPILKKMGARIEVLNQSVKGGEPVGDLHVKGGARLNGLSLDKAVVPALIDEIPLLAVAATQAKGATVLRGLDELRVKETDRLKAMAENLRKMGARIEEVDDGLLITGPTPLHGACVDSFQDHRIAMSMAVASLMARGNTDILNASCVAISYPDFWDHLKGLKG